MKSKYLLLLGAALCSLFTAVNPLLAQGTGFTYQGRLTDNGNPANGNYDLQFYLRDAPAAGNPAGTTNTLAPVPVSNGLFTVTLDFGAGVFTGPARWLEIGVRTDGSVTAYSILSPRQALTPSPYSIFATTSGTASNVVNGSVVKSLNGLKDIVTLAAGSNLTISPSGNTLTIASAGAGGSGIWSVNGNNAYYTAGNVGIGTTGPATALEANGIVRSTRTGVAPQYIQLNGGDSGSIKLTAQSTQSAEKNMFIQNLSGEATPGANNNIRFELGTTAAPSTKMTLTGNGNLGIGTTSPQDRLHVFDPDSSVSQRIETGGGVNAWSRTEYANANGQWNVGTSLGFSGDQLYFHRQGAANIAFAIQPNGDALLQGNLGIGTTTPVAKLHAETRQAYTAAVYGNAAGTGGVGVFGTGASGAAAFYADGNARQSIDKGGFVKAMLSVGIDGSILGCFNGINNTSSGGCGFVVTEPLGYAGVYRINFGFPVSGRFVSVTAQYDSLPSDSRHNFGANYRFFDSTSVEVFTFFSNNVNDTVAAKFMIILY